MKGKLVTGKNSKNRAQAAFSSGRRTPAIASIGFLRAD
jgi:hypothetical protein